MRALIFVMLVLLCAATQAAAQPPSAPSHAPAAAPPPAPARTAAQLSAEVTALINQTTYQWVAMMTPSGDFQNPFPADLARGHGPFVPPMLAYAISREGERTGDQQILRATERAWPRIVASTRASSFDTLAASYAHRNLTATPAIKEQLMQYMSAYGVPSVGQRCILRPYCWGNLKLIDALTVISVVAAGARASDPGGRLYDPTGPLASAIDLINARADRIADGGLRAKFGSTTVVGSVLSDPPADPLAYHALTAFMMREAIARLGPRASQQAKATSRELLDALSVLVSPDGDASYLGRGQDQVWVPAITAAALANGALDYAATDQARASRYLAGAQRAFKRLAGRYGSDRGLQLVPGQITRTTADGIDSYAHTVAYNGLALFALVQARDALDAAAALPIGKLPADMRLSVTDRNATGLGILADGKNWLAVRKTATYTPDLRHDAGALALKYKGATGWIDLLAPRPQTTVNDITSGPALFYRGAWLRPRGSGIHIRKRSLVINANYRAPTGKIVRRATMRWQLTGRGARLFVKGLARDDRMRMFVFTPAGTGTASAGQVFAGAASWTFSRPIRSFRVGGYHSAAIENLDAFDVRFRAPRNGRFSVVIGALSP